MLSRVTSGNAAIADRRLRVESVSSRTVGETANIIDCFDGQIGSLRFRSFDNNKLNVT